MNKQRDLDYFMQLDYDVILKRKGGVYYLFIPELSLIVKGKNLNETYEELEKEKKKYFEKAIEIDGDKKEIVKEPKNVIIKENLFTNLIPFFIKTAFVVAVFGVLSYIFVGKLSILASQSLDHVVAQSLEEINRQNLKLNRMNESDKEYLQLQIRNKVQQIKPFIDEIRVLWDEKAEMPEKSEAANRNILSEP